MTGLVPDEVDSTAWLRQGPSLGRARTALLLSLAVLTGGAWALTLCRPRWIDLPMGAAMPPAADGTGGMAQAGWPLAGGAAFLAVWTVMMAAMMLPASAPMILMFASAQARRPRGAAVSTWLFVAGYILVWAAAGLPAYALQALAGKASDLASAGQRGWVALAWGAVLAAAGLYQFSPLKRACLRQCRSPLAFIARHWREGPAGALAMGLRHGAYCLGCCWALFAVLVAAGMMSLAWMLLLALVVFIEKAVPQGLRFASILGFVLTALGLLAAGRAAAGLLTW